MNRKFLLSLFFLLVVLPQTAIASATPAFSEADLRIAKQADALANKDKWTEAFATAVKARDPLIGQLFAWRRFNAKFGNPDFRDMVVFLRRNPHWPEYDKMANRAELLIFPGTPSEIILEWFRKPNSADFRDPITGRGKIALAEAILSSDIAKEPYRTDITRWLREGWVQADFIAKDEKAFLARHGNVLRKEDHHARIDRLLWAKDVEDAQRIMPLADRDHQKLFAARIHLQTNNFGLERVINAVPEKLRRNDGLLYDRMKWREAKGQAEGMLEIMVQVPSYTAYARNWWDLRKKSITFLMEKKKYQIAYLLARQHSFTDDTVGFAEGEWLAGWIAFEYLKDYKTAYKHFYQMHLRVETPISAGRAAYWAGRASEASGFHDIARQWYQVCVRYPSSFFGQIGAAKIGHTMLNIPPQPEISREDEAAFERNELVKSAYLLYRLGQHGLAKNFLAQAVKVSTAPGEQRLIAEFGHRLKRHDYSSFTAKAAIKGKGPMLVDAYYPALVRPLMSAHGTPVTAPEDALIHSIILQESIFQPDAKSSAGALGMMQLMPGTAKDMAKKTGLPFRKDKLDNPTYNITLGSAYLQSLIKSYNGSYLLAVAAYNAGPGNVNKWIKANGDPRTMNSVEEIIEWIEKIPFPETENYVQRVIENLQLYRIRLREVSAPELNTVKDISR